MFKGSQEHARKPRSRDETLAIIISLVTIIFIAASGRSEAQVDYASIEASPALYVVEDADSTVYIFGTFHLLPPSLDWRTDEFDAAFLEAETLYLEADVANPEGQAAAQALIPQLGFNEPGVTLSSLVSETALDNVRTFAGTLGLPGDALIANLEPLQPWLASLNLAVLGIRSVGFDANAGVEMILSAEAMENGKAFGFFETAEEQLRFFADMPMELQVEQFESGSIELLSLQDGVTSLVEAWATGDLDTLEEMMNGAMLETSPELYDTIIVSRNENWIPEIEAILEGSGTQLIAVGALHLPGDHGVIPLLEANGHRVTRIQ